MKINHISGYIRAGEDITVEITTIKDLYFTWEYRNFIAFLAKFRGASRKSNCMFCSFRIHCDNIKFVFYGLLLKHYCMAALSNKPLSTIGINPGE
jgi:hypothetical protein